VVPQIGINLSRGCGNPTGFANLQPGEAVVDFGCGGGIDVILAAHKVGEHGRVVGLDFASQMIERAKQAVKESGLQDRNIELYVAGLENSQLQHSFADVVISNCVINLCPDKKAVYAEAHRILRPGGRLAISDIVLAGEMDPRLRERFKETWAGCLGGAVPEEAYWKTIKEAGFTDVTMVSRHILTPQELGAMAACPGEEFTPAPAQEDLAVVQGNVVSLKFTALKPQ
jgi:ubiquinone/menaquinone biosynthesis C-methylase UbiE